MFGIQPQQNCLTLLRAKSLCYSSVVTVGKFETSHISAFSEPQTPKDIVSFMYGLRFCRGTIMNGESQKKLRHLGKILEDLYGG